MDQKTFESLIPAFREIGCTMLDDMETDILSMEWEDECYKLIFSVRIERINDND